MNNPLATSIERLEALAGDYLESLIAEWEKVQRAQIKDLAVALVPNLRGHSPAVVVVISA
jgi:hypothetical protein